MQDMVYIGLLAVIQGLTEFLPVSSSGHLSLTQYFLAWPPTGALFLDVCLHAGTLGSTVVYFRRDLFALCRKCLEFMHWRKFLQTSEGMLLAGIAIASVPTGLIGLGLRDSFETLAKNPLFLSGAFGITGIFLFFSERTVSKEKSGAIGLMDALLCGVVQGISVIPGISRSGSTIGFLLMRGYQPAQALRFSFLASLPAIFGAGLLEGVKAFKNDSVKTGYFAGTVIAFLTGLLALKLLDRVVAKKKFSLFGVYLMILGAALAFFCGIRVWKS
ncbi:MAG: undecaprenyl-diphosphate phosphatase [Candidatus Wallbacteria bacterium]|nr:undecaprenyl-diphosphate phosphatase [Candidatus Wallbacteria bacterium]